ncbi:hypothetical protein L6452_32907 [Arctium lappa]|uniref:Uncharacterized protein n=1 Tax=Arctium lappa TaxID=4217 RepID=A0ACB8Z5Y9_ARCLA|nr:hypothetical protein L6452_32907 [Arctium lappa]
MVRVSVVNDALNSMYNAEKNGKRQVMIWPSSKVIIKSVKSYAKAWLHSPRFDIGVKEIEPWTARLLPSR